MKNNELRKLRDGYTLQGFMYLPQVEPVVWLAKVHLPTGSITLADIITLTVGEMGARSIIAVAGARPETLGVPAMRWSLKRLARYLRGQGIVEWPEHPRSRGGGVNPNSCPVPRLWAGISDGPA